MLIEGRYAVLSDSVSCVDCYYVGSDSTLYKILKTDFNELRVGIWKYYYENGQLKEKGKYAKHIRISASSALFSSKTQYQYEGPVAAGFGPEYLREGAWEIYDENGYLIKVIWYHEGRIIKEQYAPMR